MKTCKHFKFVGAVCAAAGLVTPGLLLANDIDWDIYGSLRLGAEYVDHDANAGNGVPADSYTGLRDAYSRIGAKATYKLNDDWSLMGQLEAPFDLANMRLSDPSDGSDDYDNIRVAKIQVSGPLGTAWYGQGWVAYYNYIAYPLDYFNSYYSGWATTSTFRQDETFYYATPVLNGFQGAFSTSEDSGNQGDRRNQYVLSYNFEGLTLSYGLDDLDGIENQKSQGFAASYSSGAWYVAAKYEDDDLGNDVSNLLVQYAVDEKNTVRGMFADAYDVDNLHLGLEHQFNDDLMFWGEYYWEDAAYVIADDNDPQKANTAGGGDVFTIGVRYDFSSQ